MRILVILASTLVLAAIGFVVYWTMAGPDGVHIQEPSRRQRRNMAATLPSGEGFGPGEKVWWNRYDGEGRRTSRIRVSRYKPMKDGRFFVNDPECEFFLHDGQVMHIEGKTGFIITQESISHSKNIPAGTPTRAPRSGDLKDVTLKLFENEAAAKPTMVMTMNNASFDNETFRIQTEDFEDAAGNTIAGDRVPIQMRGEDYDFDGRGLRLQYNDVDRRLEYLKVFHGERLLIKKPGNLRQLRSAPGPTTRPAAAFVPALPIPDIILAAADDDAAREAAPRRARPKTPPATRPAPPEPVYRAIFKDAIVITQSNQRLAAADEMHVDFISEDSGPMLGGATTKPTARSTTRPARGLRGENMSGTAGPTTKPVRKLASATTRPTTNPIDEPLEIRWTGPLTITPVQGDRPDRIAPGEAIVKLIAREGKFVELNREANNVKSHIRGGTLTHWTIDQGALIEEGPGTPVVMTDTRGTHIITRRMLFSQADGTALLYGKSHAQLPTEETAAAKLKDPNARPDMLSVDWLDRCTLYFEGDDPDNLIIHRADLVGSVAVKTRQIEMTSNALNLYFDAPSAAPAAPTTQPRRVDPALRQLDAFGSVKALLRGPGGDADIRRLECDNLKLRTARAPDGRLYARNLDAIGSVRTSDPKSNLAAGNLHAVLALPSTQPTARATTRPAEMDAGNLESLVAYDNVNATLEDGSRADARRLDIQIKDGKRSVTLQGQPAVITRRDGKLIGEIIHIAPDTETLSVTGPGQMDGMHRPEGATAARPISIKWEKSLLGHDNVIECIGGVVVQTTGVDGSRDIARGRQVTLTTSRPTTRPTTKPALAAANPTTKPTTKPTTRPSDFDIMAGREIASVILDGSAAVTSELYDDKAALLVMRHIDAERMEFYQSDQKARRINIPVPGRMITVDNRPPSTQPAAADSDPMSMRGQVAFQWNRSLVYDEKVGQVVMSGGVQVARQEQGPKPQTLRMNGDLLTADIETPQPTTKPAGAAPAAANVAMPAKLNIKKVRVEGDVEVRSGSLHVRAETIDYDPQKHLLIARGLGRKRVQQFNDKGLETASFDEFVYDTVKGIIIDSNNPIFTDQK